MLIARQCKNKYSYSCCIILLQCRCQGLVEKLIVAKSDIILVYMSRTASDISIEEEAIRFSHGSAWQKLAIKSNNRWLIESHLHKPRQLCIWHHSYGEQVYLKFRNVLLKFKHIKQKGKQVHWPKISFRARSRTYLDFSNVAQRWAWFGSWKPLIIRSSLIIGLLWLQKSRWTH